MNLRRFCLSFMLLFMTNINLASAEMTGRQMQLMVNNCLQCHANSAIDAPLMGDIETWAKFREKGEAQMLKNVVDGIRGMPPYGYCSACTEDDLRVLMRTIAGIRDEETGE